MRRVFLSCLILVLAMFTASPAAAEDHVAWGFDCSFGMGTGATATSVTDIPENIRTVETYNPSYEDRISWVIPDAPMKLGSSIVGHVEFGPVLAVGPVRFRAGFGFDGSVLVDETAASHSPGAGYKCYGDPPTYKANNSGYPVPDSMLCYNEGQQVGDNVTHRRFPIFLSAWPSHVFLAYGGVEYRVSRIIGLTAGYTFRLYRVNFVSGVDSWGGENELQYHSGAQTSSVDTGIRFYLNGKDEDGLDAGIELAGSWNKHASTDLHLGEKSYSVRIAFVVQRIVK